MLGTGDRSQPLYLDPDHWRGGIQEVLRVKELPKHPGHVPVELWSIIADHTNAEVLIAPNVHDSVDLHDKEDYYKSAHKCTADRQGINEAIQHLIATRPIEGQDGSKQNTTEGGSQFEAARCAVCLDPPEGARRGLGGVSMSNTRELPAWHAR